jgi:LysM repeat protein
MTAPAAAPSNPVYDTPAAYEESTGTPAPAVASPNIPATPTTASVAPAIPKAPSNGAAIIHTVVAGDTLSGISAKYKVPAAAIKQANNMTKDTVVLGKKMVIPPVH